MPEGLKPAGYLLIHQDWYEDPGEEQPLLRNARVSTLNPKRFAPSHGVQLVKRCYEVREITESTPVEFTIGEARPVGQDHYETLEEAQDYLREIGISHPRVGFNPIE